MIEYSVVAQHEPRPREHYFGVGPYGEEEWVVVNEIREPLDHELQGKRRVVYDVLVGSEEGRTTSYPVDQFLQEYRLDEILWPADQ